MWLLLITTGTARLCSGAFKDSLHHVKIKCVKESGCSDWLGQRSSWLRSGPARPTNSCVADFHSSFDVSTNWQRWRNKFSGMVFTLQRRGCVTRDPWVFLLFFFCGKPSDLMSRILQLDHHLFTPGGLCRGENMWNKYKLGINIFQKKKKKNAESLLEATCLSYTHQQACHVSY